MTELDFLLSIERCEVELQTLCGVCETICRQFNLYDLDIDFNQLFRPTDYYDIPYWLGKRSELNIETRLIFLHSFRDYYLVNELYKDIKQIY